MAERIIVSATLFPDSAAGKPPPRLASTVVPRLLSQTAQCRAGRPARDLLEGVSLTASNLDGQGCPSATTFTSRTFTVALDNSTACSVPAGTPVRLSFAITALSTLLSQLVTFTLTTTRGQGVTSPLAAGVSGGLPPRQG